MTEAQQELLKLQEIVKRLRASDGCPWDQEQTPESMVPYLIEEAYEVVEAIENGKTQDLLKELGDLQLHIVMQAQMAEEKQEFSLKDALASINEKLIRRHPHVFLKKGDAEARKADATFNWEKAKQEEGRSSWLDGVPKNMPALIRAQRIQEKASQVGFDWDAVEPTLEKFHEEIDEVLEVWRQGDHKRSQEEFGDVLFALVNVSRLMKIDSETALRQAIDKFDARFRAMEQVFKAEERELEKATLEEMDAVWDRIKHQVSYRR